MDPVCRILKVWGNKRCRISFFDLSNGLMIVKAVRKSQIGVASNLVQAILFAGCEVEAANVVIIVERRVGSPTGSEGTRDRVIKKTNAASQANLIGDADRVPFKRRPQRRGDGR